MASQTTPLAPPQPAKRPLMTGATGRASTWANSPTPSCLLARSAIVPFFYTVSVSLMNLTEATGGAWLPRAPQWGNYEQAWRDAAFRSTS